MSLTLETLTSATLGPVHHGFFTRKGGASSGIFAGLNCGPGSSDLASAVEVNRTRVAEHMGVAPDHLVTIHQVHSADVAVIDGPLRALPRADAMVTRTHGVALGILTADCQPVLFSDPEAGVIGAAHAGWRGAFDGVLEATVEAMIALGARRQAIRAVIGPCISQSAYEVGPEFFQRFREEEAGLDRFFTQGSGDRLRFDLPAFGLHRLREAGIEQAEWIGRCTYADEDRFYSYRRTTHRGEADYGRLISVIRL